MKIKKITSTFNKDICASVELTDDKTDRLITFTGLEGRKLTHEDYVDLMDMVDEMIDSIEVKDHE